MFALTCLETAVLPGLLGGVFAFTLASHRSRVAKAIEESRSAREARTATFENAAAQREEHETLSAARYSEAQLHWASIAVLFTLDTAFVGVFAQLVLSEKNLGSYALAVSVAGAVVACVGLLAIERLGDYHELRLSQVKSLENEAVAGNGMIYRPHADGQVEGLSNRWLVRIIGATFTASSSSQQAMSSCVRTGLHSQNCSLTRRCSSRRGLVRMAAASFATAASIDRAAAERHVR